MAADMLITAISADSTPGEVGYAALFRDVKRYSHFSNVTGGEPSGSTFWQRTTAWIRSRVMPFCTAGDLSMVAT